MNCQKNTEIHCQRTRKAILDTAEYLFGENGIKSTSIRDIAGIAGVNLAAVNYHFGSKDALAVAVFARYIEPLSRECLRRLEKLDRKAKTTRVTVEEILAAYFEPIIKGRFSAEGSNLSEPFFRLMSRSYLEADERLQTALKPYFSVITIRLCGLIKEAVPYLSRREIQWRIAFCIGAFNHALHHWTCERSHSRQVTDGTTTAEQSAADLEKIVAELIAFSSEGFRAASLESGKARSPLRFSSKGGGSFPTLPLTHFLPD